MTLVEFDGEIEGPQWTTVEIEILGVKVKLYCFTSSAVVGKLSVDCAEC